MKKVDESSLRAAILVQLFEHRGEEIAVDELVKDLVDAGFFKAYIEGLLSDLFTEQQGVLLCGEPLGTSVMMPEDFQPSDVLVAAHQSVAKEAFRNTAKALPTYFKRITAG